MAAGTVLAVLLVKALLVTSCFIPSSGMENSLYQGEGVLVNKWSYGLRLPFPSVWGYHRLGISPVQRGDVVLFNNPKPENPGQRLEFRKLFISRCTGLPGDTLMLNHEMMDVGSPVFSPDAKSLYTYPGSKEDILLALLDVVGIKGNTLVGYTENGDYIRSFSAYELYLLSQKAGDYLIFTPLNQTEKNKEAYPFVVPARGYSVKVYPWNRALLCNTIVQHEGRQAQIKGDTLWVEGIPVKEYTFSKNYYWMSANDPVNLCDSRLFGFVPEDHLIGKAWCIWFPVSWERFLQRVQ